jgi:hypothetical protein
MPANKSARTAASRAAATQAADDTSATGTADDVTLKEAVTVLLFARARLAAIAEGGDELSVGNATAALQRIDTFLADLPKPDAGSAA